MASSDLPPPPATPAADGAQARQRWQRLRQLLAELDELTPEERDARLLALEPDLAAEARELLAAGDADASAFFAGAVAAGAAAVLDSAESPTLAGALGRASDHGDEAPTSASGRGGGDEGGAGSHGERIGAWRLVRPLGGGGMGEVWEVEHADPDLRQRAALKLLKRGIDSEDVVRRFRQERQILARLRHPAIAHLYDGGVAADGRPYFVMELVPGGEPITTAAARRQLSLDERLRLFLTVCEAVETAHRSLVVHRDLKPTNVLVGAGGEVKLLDFGIAKLLEGEPDDGATAVWQRLMTPAYASPEQVFGEPVTTATDVYALGVVLYELLAGRRPYRRDLSSAARLVEVVTRETAERPSLAVLDAGEAVEPISPAERQLRAKRLRGDLDWIVLKALAREPERRYPTAAALAADLRRHLDGRPVEARPDALGYRAGKFVRRHCVGVAAAALVLLSLLGGLAVALWQAREARAQAARARQATSRALAAAEQARRETSRAEKIAGFLKGMILEANPNARSSGEPLTLLEVVQQGASRVEEQLRGEPTVQAQMMIFFGDLALTLEDMEGAAKLIERAHAIATGTPGVDARTVADSEGSLGQLRYQQRRLGEAEASFKSALARLERLLAADPADARALELTGIISNLYAQTLWYQDRVGEAIALAERGLGIHTRIHGAESPDVAIDVTNLGAMQDSAGRLADAERSYRRSLALHTKLFGPEDARIHYVASGLADVIGEQGKLDEAYALSERALLAARKGFGEAHSTVAFDLLNLAKVRLAQGRLDEAAARLGEALRVADAVSSRDLRAKVHEAWGELESRRGRLDAAAGHYRQAQEQLASRGRTGSTDDLLIAVELARLRAARGEAGAAADELAGLVEKIRPQAPSAAEVVAAMRAHGEALLLAGRVEPAVARLREAVALGEKGLGAERLATARAELMLGLALQAQSAGAAEARQRLTAAVRRLEGLGRGSLPEVARARAALAAPAAAAAPAPATR